MTRRPDLPQLEARAYRVQELRLLGVPDRRLLATDIRRAARGIVLHPDFGPDLQTVEGRCRSIVPMLRAGQFFSRQTAATLWGMPSFFSPQALLDVGAVHPHHAPRRPEVSGHRVMPGRVTRQLHRGLPVASPEDTWCLLGPFLSHGELIALGDFLISERNTGNRWKAAALSTPDRIRVAAARYSGARGARDLARALPRIRSGVDSPAETQLRLIIVDAGFAEPRLQCPVPVRGRPANRPLHADLGYERRRLAIEYEGRYHFTGGEEQSRRDIERWEQMTDAGWRVLRATARDLRDPAPFLARLASALGTARGSR